MTDAKYEKYLELYESIFKSDEEFVKFFEDRHKELGFTEEECVMFIQNKYHNVTFRKLSEKFNITHVQARQRINHIHANVYKVLCSGLIGRVYQSYLKTSKDVRNSSDLSKRTINILSSNGIVTLNDIIKFCDGNSLLSLKGFGDKSLAEVIIFSEEYHERIH